MGRGSAPSSRASAKLDAGMAIAEGWPRKELPMKRSSILILTLAMIGCGDYEAGGDIDGEATEEIQSALSQAARCQKVREKSATLSWKGSVTASCDNRDHGNGASELYTNAGVWFSDALNRAHEVHGAIGNMYLAGGAQFSPVGYPTADESNPLFGGGKYSPFQFGNIYWKNAAASAFAVYGAIGSLYFNLSAEWGNLGWPTGNEFTLASRRKQDYESGKLNYTAAKGAWPTMTSSGNFSNHLDDRLMPEITAMNIVAASGGLATISATAVRLTPGRTVELRLTNPANGITTFGTGTVQATGMVNFSFLTNLNNVWRVGGSSTGFVTFWVYQDAGNQAVAGKSTSLGNNFLGQY
jgi:hypothetical protein